MKNIIAGLIVVVCLSYGQNIPKSNISGGNGMVLPNNKTRLIIKYISFLKNNAYDNDNKVEDLKNRKLKVKKIIFIMKKGVGHNTEVIVKIPDIYKNLNQTIMNKNFNMTNSGIGDISLILKHELLSQKKGNFAFLCIGAGIKLPTGKTNKSFLTPIGIKKPDKTQTLQLGSGSYDYRMGISFTKIINFSRIDANVHYIYTTKGSNDYKFGNSFHWNIGYVYSINNIFAIQIDFNGINLNKDKYKNNAINSTGGNFIYMIPGFQIRFNKQLDLSIGYSRMIKRDNNFDTKNNIGGLSEEYRFLARLGYTF